MHDAGPEANNFVEIPQPKDDLPEKLTFYGNAVSFVFYDVAVGGYHPLRGFRCGTGFLDRFCHTRGRNGSKKYLGNS
jgi:hypothetical protein